MRKIVLHHRGKLALAAMALLVGGSALALLREPRQPVVKMVSAPAAALTVNVTTPQKVVLTRTVSASGSVMPRDELIVGSDAAGVRLLEVQVEVGSQVKRGQLLARGDDAQLSAQLAQHDAMLRQAAAELSQASANLQRAEAVQDSGLYSEEVLLSRRTAVATLAAKLDLVRAQKRELEVKRAQTRVLAPADGVIARRSATVGAVVQPGSELFRLIRDDQLEWLAELPAHALARVKPGALVRIALDDGRSLAAEVRRVAPTLDARTRNGLVHVALPKGASGTALKSGAHASGEIALEQVSVLTVPESSVLQRDGQSYVWKLDANEVAHLVRIETGARQRGLVEVTAGLEPGTRVVATGAGFVKDGERVRVATRPALPQNKTEES